MTPFETIDHLTVYKTKWYDLSVKDRNSYNSFMVNKTLSMDKNNIDTINMIQEYGRTTSIIPVKNLYQMYINILPERKMYPKYIKRSADKYNKDLLKILADHYQISTDNAKEYVSRLDPKVIEHMLYSMGYDDKSIKKYMK